MCLGNKGKVPATKVPAPAPQVDDEPPIAPVVDEESSSSGQRKNRSKLKIPIAVGTGVNVVR